MKKKVPAEALKRFVAQAFMKVGMKRGDAALIAETLVWANLRGVDSHGVTRLPRYLEMVDQGLMNVNAAPVISEPTAASVVIQSDRAPGPVVMSLAVERLIALAPRHGIAMALVSRMTHSGALGFYTEKLALAGLACIVVNAGNPFMPYHGAHGAAMGTNPISIAVPGGEEDPILFDMASSAVSLGRLTLARKTGAPLEPGWAVDKSGKPTTDPAHAVMTAPLGGPKGSGLALMIECLASLLAGHPLVADALQKSGEGATHRQNALLIAIDVSMFVDLSEFRAQVERLVAALKAMPLAPDFNEILMPGERGYGAANERRESGIPLPPAILSELATVAERLCIEPLAP
jgi:ureidoglycolate dehydrogenase (NAD+)